MKILQICHRVPYPPLDGGNIAMMNMALSLDEAGNEVHQFSLNTSKHFVRNEQLPAELVSRLHMKSSFIDTRVTWQGAIKNLFAKGSYNIERFVASSVAHDLIGLLKEREFDIVQMETLFATGYIDIIRSYSKAKIVLRAHNVEHIIWERLAASENNPVKKAYLKFLSKRLKQYELDILNKVDAIVPITPVDEQLYTSFGFSRPMITLPLGVDLNDYPIQNIPTEMALFHLGSMDWLPNIEGVKWFLEKCWPLIHGQFPSLKFYLAGRSFPEELQKAVYPNVIIEGAVENANDFISSKQIMIVPLLSGSGMRVKIIQGLALKRTIISTTIGAEGIHVENDRNILIADTPEQFLAAITKCLSDQSMMLKIGENARKLIEQDYSNKAIGIRLSEFYKSLY